jgi:tetratricopeptide (TPR) repeat protein
MGLDLDGALADCREALTLQPGDPYTRDNMGLIYLKQKYYDKAIAEYDASLKLDPSRARALYGRGFAKSKRGEAPAGINDMTTATGIQPNIGSEFAKYGVR